MLKALPSNVIQLDKWSFKHVCYSMQNVTDLGRSITSLMIVLAHASNLHHTQRGV
ncbi:MAG: hypothetical protein NPIRA05_06990 [Nitrospirales bacterium]|nr:MAG: hypothetical protein NPIRA05_06990 [Nitrospirales bacterium]